MKTKPIKYPYYWLALSMCIGVGANAQKLPNVQSTAVYAPANVKIDGKAIEWNNQLQAYNKSTSIYYTIANNADNLILVVQATDKAIVEKILGGGLTLTIKDEKNKSTSPVIITSPILSSAARSGIMGKLRGPGTVIDSVLLELNKELLTNFKEIKVEGVKAIKDSSISVYNEYGIKAAAAMDMNKVYTYEFIIPLKYIEKTFNSQRTFNYNIRLNGMEVPVRRIIINGNAVDPSSPEAAQYLGQAAIAPGNELASPTDFSGTYTLTKK